MTHVTTWTGDSYCIECWNWEGENIRERTAAGAGAHPQDESARGEDAAGKRRATTATKPSCARATRTTAHTTSFMRITANTKAAPSQGLGRVAARAARTTSPTTSRTRKVS